MQLSGEGLVKPGFFRLIPESALAPF